MKLNPDGVDIDVYDKTFTVGASFFLPCIDTTEAKRQIEKIAKLNKWQVKVVIVVENSKYGARVWRTV